MTLPLARGLAAAVLVLALVSGCEAASLPATTPTFEDVSPILERACAECHGDSSRSGDTPAAGWSTARYTDVIGCAEGRDLPPTAPGDASSLLVAVLDQEDHAGLVTDAERRLLLAWLLAGAVSRPPAMHPTGFADPRAAEFHGAALRAERWAAMLDPTLEGSCGRCHAGAPTRPEGVIGSAGDAPACTSCHDEAQGVLSCTTCHGSEGHAYPPRDACFFGAASGDIGAHAKHVDDVGLDCSVCHGEHTTDLTGIHGDGLVQIEFNDPRADAFPERLAGTVASYDADTKTCTVGCHDRGGDLPTPVWGADTGPLHCNSCHHAPPDDHYAGDCTSCHAEPNADGTALQPGPFHLDGVVELGDGSADCTACHGIDLEGWPTGGAHPAHREPGLRVRVPCGTCHQVPTDPMDVGHFDRSLGPEVRLTGLAAARGASPSFDGSNCSDVACHGAGLPGGTLTTPAWNDASGAPAECGACHAIPPGAPHPNRTTCASPVCHGDEIVPTSPPRISPTGRSVHIDGVIQHGTVTP